MGRGHVFVGGLQLSMRWPWGATIENACRPAQLNSAIVLGEKLTGYHL
jgi:hypothetical protein